MARQAAMPLAVMIASAGLASAGYLAAPGWPKEPTTNKAKACAYPPKVLHDHLTDGWPAKCMGLAQVTTVTKYTAASCGAECTKNPECMAWQLTPLEECWVSVPGNRCENGVGGQGRESNMTAGQRIQHGKVIVKRSLAGMWISSGMKQIGTMAPSSNADLSRQRCRDQCYSDISCRYWLWGGSGSNAGCWVEAQPNQVVSDPPPLEKTGANALTTAYGEEIDHICPPWPTPEPPAAKKSSLGLILGIIGGVVLLGILAAVIYFLFCQSSAPKAKKTRAVKIQPKKEPLAMAPMPLLAPTYTTYVSPTPTYQVVAQAPPVEYIQAPVASIVAPAPAQYSVASPIVASTPTVTTVPVGGSVIVG